jgi:GNAT superfamily N-acetyltransferase
MAVTTPERAGSDDALRARQMWRTLEPYHGIVYFTPHAAEQYGRLGIEGRDGYFASRAAPLGPVSAEVVIATFYNFHPSLVRRAIPKVWDIAAPAEICAARLRAADLALREVLGDEAESEDVAEAATLAERAARSAQVAGRPLFAAHAALPWPDPPHLVLWHAIALLREHRGDGHIAALLTAGLDPCEALVTHGADESSGVSAGVLRTSRAWPEEDWAAAVRRLQARGLLDGERLSEAGAALRAQVERVTDEAAAPAWSVLSDEEAARLRALVRPWSRRIVQSGAFGLREPS